MRVMTVRDVVRYLEDVGQDPRLDGDANLPIPSFCSLSSPKDGHITWAKRATSMNGTLPRCVVIAPAGTVLEQVPGASAVIAVKGPKAAFFGLLGHFWGEGRPTGVSASAVVLGSIGKDVYIGEHSYIGPNVIVGDGTQILHNVIICCPATIGRNCLIGPGTVIGMDGYGYYLEDGIPMRVEHFGGVRIGDRVDIGANSCIDRGTLDDTEIGDDTKVDNLVHIGHNVRVGSRVLIIAGAVICGSSVLGDDSYVGPGAIVRNQLRVADGTTVGMGAVLNRDLDKGNLATAEMATVMQVPEKILRAVRDSGLRRKDD